MFENCNFLVIVLKVKRRLSIKNMHLAKEAFIQASFRRRQTNFSNVVVTDSVQTSSSQNHHQINTDLTPNDMTPLPNESRHRHHPTSEFLDAITPEPPVTTVPASMNLREAELLLESLTLCGNSSPTSPDSYSNTIHEGESSISDRAGPSEQQLVEVEVEVEIAEDDNDIPSPSAFTDINIPFQYETGLNRAEDGNNETPYNRSNSVTEHCDQNHDQQVVVLRRSRTTPKLSSSSDAGSEFHGWRRSSIEVTSNPPVTLCKKNHTS